jgi:branched-subunit amino acid ABC-type transport system permease component
MSAMSKAPTIPETFQLVKDYARQETLGPLKGAGRWIAFGAAGAISFALGSVFLVLGVLRLVQNEWGGTFAGRWMSLLPYVIALVVALAIIGIAVSRISKTSLHRDRD